LTFFDALAYFGPGRLPAQVRVATSAVIPDVVAVFSPVAQKRRKMYMEAVTTPVKDPQTVTPSGERVTPLIAGVTIRSLVTHEDERGDLFEMYDPAWGVHPDPLVYVYQTSLRPGMIKGWIVHEKQDDRIATMIGHMRWVLFDNRPDSSTYRHLNVHTLSERVRSLLIIPRGVYHAVENVGTSDAIFVNMPTRAYDHADPDKYRLPLKNDLIPFDFGGRGW
jgi:dTDP-4-dehydrorhamnose 3,5-epimerase